MNVRCHSVLLITCALWNGHGTSSFLFLYNGFGNLYVILLFIFLIVGCFLFVIALYKNETKHTYKTLYDVKILMTHTQERKQ